MSETTQYIILSYSESAGANMINVGHEEAEKPKEAVMNYLNNQTNRTVQIKEGTGSNGYTSVPEQNWNTFTARSV